MKDTRYNNHENNTKNLWLEIIAELKPFRFKIVCATILGIAVAAISLIQPALVGAIVNSAKYGLDKYLITISALGLALAALLSALEQYILERISESMVFTIRMRMAARVLDASLKQIESVESGDLTSALGSDTAQLRGILSQGIVELLVQSLTLFGALIMMFYIDWTLFLVVIIAVIGLIISGILLGTRTRPAAESVQHSVAAMSVHFGRVLSGIRTVKAFCGEPTFLKGIQNAALSAQDSGFRVARLKALVAGFTQSAIQILLFTVIGFGAIRVSSGGLTVGELTSFVMYVMLVFTPAAMLGGVVSAISEGLGAYSRVSRFSSWESECTGKRNFLFKVEPDSPAIIFKNVSFSYDAQDLDSSSSQSTFALQNFSITVPQGAFAAFVGRSGAGKSTIFNILECFNQPTSGEVLVFGQNLESIDPKTVRQNYALVDQSAPVFAGSIRENLQFVQPNASDAELIDALESARLHVNGQTPALSLPLGEGGLGLSGGERQRLAIARAFLSEAPIILLDEATSNLDSITEQEVHSSLFKLRRQRTVLAIAHRLATVVTADIIYVVDGGQLIAEGSHQSLMETCEIYRDLVISQQLLS